ncbi:hypothetical protein FHS96_004592 [Sphingomonas zeicaulis]
MRVPFKQIGSAGLAGTIALPEFVPQLPRSPR